MLETLSTSKPRPSAVHVWAPPPTKAGGEGIGTALGALRSRRVSLRWSLPPLEAGVGADRSRRSRVADVVDDAVRARARATRSRAERFLRKLGVHVLPAMEPSAGAEGSESAPQPPSASPLESSS